MHRHKSVARDAVQARLEANPGALRPLGAMEVTGGEPDVIGQADETGHFAFCDCSQEPKSSAVETAAEMGIDLLTEEQYRELQKLGEFDTETSSWIKTPPEIRSLGGALFCDLRYGKVFVYHNGAQSYYAARAFRGSLSL